MSSGPDGSSSSSPQPSSTSSDGRGDGVLSRRRLLAALGATGVGLAVYGTQLYVPEEPDGNPPASLETVQDTPADVWNAVGGGYGNSRHLAVDPITDPTVAWSEAVRGTVGAVTVEWTHPVDLTVVRRFDPPIEPLLSTPLVVDGTLYVGVAPVVDSSPTDPEYIAAEAGILALSTETGERRWFQRLGFRPTTLAAVDGRSSPAAARPSPSCGTGHGAEGRGLRSPSERTGRLDGRSPASMRPRVDPNP